MKRKMETKWQKNNVRVIQEVKIMSMSAASLTEMG